MEFKDQTVLILGGNSDVGKSLAVAFSKLGSNLILSSRKERQLDSFKSDLVIRYNIKCTIEIFDVLDFDSHYSFYNNLKVQPDVVITCIGYLDDLSVSKKNFETSLKTIQTNYTGLVSILNIISNNFEKKTHGIIVGISSVAGDRGRGSNYIYGSSKSAFTSYLSGLRNRLHTSGVRVITVKPGFIKSKMTNHLKLPKMLTASPDQISLDIIKSIKRKKNVVYTQWFWMWIMWVIQCIPERVFKKLSL